MNQAGIRVLTAVVGVGLFVAPLSADLKYTVHIDMHPVAAPADSTGGYDRVMYESDKGIRVETKLGTAARDATIYLPDRVVLHLRSATKTYWKTTLAADAPIDPATLALGVESTNETETIVGRSGHHVIATASNPAKPNAAPMVFDLWVTDDVKRPAFNVPAASVVFNPTDLLVWDAVAKQGFALKEVTRQSGVQQTMVVTELSTNAVLPDSLFQVPAGYKEVPPPGRGGR